MQPRLLCDRDSLNFLTEELKDPFRNLPLAVYISMPLISIVYILANISYFSVLSPDELVESTAVAVVSACSRSASSSSRQPSPS